MNHHDIVDVNSIIYKAASMVAVDMIEGDYYEFGVFRGGSFIQAHWALTRAFEERSRQNDHGVYEHDSIARIKQYQEMRYVAVDSFQGLPEIVGLDKITAEFEQGKYCCSQDQFIKNIAEGGVPLNKVFQDSIMNLSLRMR
jgi:hypothetical protein